MYLPHNGQSDPDINLKARHSVTDGPCCGIFGLALAVFVGIYAWAIAHGVVARLYHGTNYKHQVCGVSAMVANAPYLYWCPSSIGPDSLSLDLDRPVCVTSCPGRVPVIEQGLPVPMQMIEPDCADISGAEGMVSYKTRLSRDRYCLPDEQEHPDLARKIMEFRLVGIRANLLDSLTLLPPATRVLALAFLVALSLGYLYLALLRSCAEALIRFSLLFSVVGLILAGVCLWNTGAGGLGRSSAPTMSAFGHGTKEGEAALTRVFAWMAWGLAILTACVACSLQYSASVTAACVEVSCHTVLEMRCPLLLAPALRALCEAALAPALLHGLFLLCSCAQADSDHSSVHIFGVNIPQALLVTSYVSVSLWLVFYVHALYQFTVAFVIVEYYYTPFDHDDEKDVGCCSVWDGLSVGLCRHSGSLAFGSLFICFLSSFQWLAGFTEQIQRRALSSSNEVIAAMCCCCARTAKCWRDGLSFVGKNAYIEMAITSRSFCESARQSQRVITSLGDSIAVLNGAVSILATFGTITIMLATAYVVSARGALNDRSSALHVGDPAAVIGVCMIIALRVASCFMSLLDVTSDTLLYCYGIDLQSGKGSTTAPEVLKQLVHASEEEHS